MHIKEANNENWLVHCSWTVSRFCADKDKDVKQEANNLNIPVDRITSSCCYSCNAIMAYNEGLPLEPFERTLLKIEHEQNTDKIKEIVNYAREQAMILVQTETISREEYKQRIYALTSIQAKL